MRILLDECLPARLRRELPGHDVLTVPRAAQFWNRNILAAVGDTPDAQKISTVAAEGA